MEKTTYKGYVSYMVDGGKCVYERSGFETVADATKWISSRFADIMLNWASINENGLTVYGEVCDEDPEGSVGFTDCYELNCGM